MKYIKNFFIVVLIGIAAYLYLQNDRSPTDLPSIKSADNNQSVLNAVHKRLKNVQVSGSGKVSRILSDDNYGNRHQRFILRLSPKQTILIAHNIDLAPRINKLKSGDVVEFYGEFEWNSKGGVVHWTHHDPNGNHKDGWLKHNGRIYK